MEAHGPATGTHPSSAQAGMVATSAFEGRQSQHAVRVGLAASFPSSELGVLGTMRLPNRKEELARDQSTLPAARRG